MSTRKGIEKNAHARNIVVKEGIHLTSVTRAGCNDSKPKILFYAEWISRMGFTPDALTQFLPEDGGAAYVLRNENIPSYSELLRETKEKGGALIHPIRFKHRESPCICVSGAAVRNAGLQYGDNLIALYEYGLIRMRKLPDDGSRVLNARIFGKWLEVLGFLPGEVLTVGSEPGLIACTLQENGQARAAELVKYAREKRLNLVQINKMQDNNNAPAFEIPPSRLEKAGFLPDEVFRAECGHGRIQLQKLDFVGLGF